VASPNTETRCGAESRAATSLSGFRVRRRSSISGQGTASSSITSAQRRNVQLVLHDCTKEWPLPAASIDVVFTSNFLEHLPDKDAVIEACRQAHRVLKPGGRLVAIGPNARFVGGKYWDYFDHHIPLTERSLGEALAATGFDVTKSIGRFLPYTMSGNRQRPVALVSAYLRLPAAWKLLGEQFLVVARRPVG
jgi:SAM-dependent methyltransferase